MGGGFCEYFFFLFMCFVGFFVVVFVYLCGLFFGFGICICMDWFVNVVLVYGLRMEMLWSVLIWCLACYFFLDDVLGVIDVFFMRGVFGGVVYVLGGGLGW